jgi:hypothetical protein
VRVKAERGPAFAIESAANLELDGVAGKPAVLTGAPGAIVR